MSGQNRGFMATVKLGPKGQLVIPKEVREMFGLEPGDSLLLMADPRRGIALQRASVMNKIADAIFAGHGQEVYPQGPQEHLEEFARGIRQASEEAES